MVANTTTYLSFCITGTHLSSRAVRENSPAISGHRAARVILFCGMPTTGDEKTYQNEAHNLMCTAIKVANQKVDSPGFDIRFEACDVQSIFPGLTAGISIKLQYGIGRIGRRLLITSLGRVCICCMRAGQERFLYFEPDTGLAWLLYFKPDTGLACLQEHANVRCTSMCNPSGPVYDLAVRLVREYVANHGSPPPRPAWITHAKAVECVEKAVVARKCGTHMQVKPTETSQAIEEAATAAQTAAASAVLLSIARSVSPALTVAPRAFSGFLPRF